MVVVPLVTQLTAGRSARSIGGNWIASGNRYLCAIAQAIRAIDHDCLTWREPVHDIDLVAIRGAKRHGPHADRAIRLHEKHKRARGAALDRCAWNGRLVVEGVDEKTHVDELGREQCVAAVVEDGSHL